MNIRVRKDRVEIDGYVNAVERLSRPLKDRLGEFVERIKAGAFRKALDRAEDVRIFLNHDYHKDLGGISDGNLELHEDSIGLHARATITNEEVVRDAKEGNLVGWSFGFTDRDVEMGEENGMTVRNVKDLDLFEVSLINREAVPAYEGTIVSVRTADKTMNVSEVSETEVNVRIIEDVNENQNSEQKEIDYTEYYDMIQEMKGEK